MRVLVGVPVALYALYLVAVNAILATPLFGLIVNNTPEAVDVHFASAWSLYPTHLHAKELRIRGMDGHVQWVLALDEVTFDMNLRELVKQRFHVTKARGSGISYRVRERVESPRATEALVSHLPPVDGQGPVGLLPSDPPYPGTWSDPDWNLWTILLEDVVADDVREVWIDGARFRGRATIGGGFFLEPIRVVRVGPLDVRAEGVVDVDDRRVLEPLSIHASGEIAAFDPRLTETADLLHHVTVELDGTASVPDVAHLPLPYGAPHVQGRLDFPELAVAIHRGVCGDGTRLVARAPSLAAQIDERAASATGIELRAKVDEGRLAATLHAPRASFGRHARADGITVSVDSKQLDLASPLGDAHGELRVAEIASDDVTKLASDAPSDPAAPGGSAKVDARVEAWRAARRLVADVSGQIDGLALGDAPRGHAAGEARVHVEMRPRPGGADRYDVDGTTLSLHGVHLLEGEKRGAWSGDLALKEATLDLASAPRLDTDVAVRVDGVAALIPMVTGDSPPLVVKEATVGIDPVVVTAHARAGAGNAAITNVDARGGNVKARGFVERVRAHTAGAFVVSKGFVSIGLAIRDDGAHVHLFGLDDWLREETQRAGGGGSGG